MKTKTADKESFVSRPSKVTRKAQKEKKLP